MLRWLPLAVWIFAAPALAAWHSVLQVSVGGSAFTGAGDIVSGATAWYGFRGYSAAVAATGTQKAINVRRQSDNTTSDILILTNGNLDTTTANSFAGTDATCTGTIASTTMALTSCSSTPTANDPVSGAGIVQPAFIVSCGTFTAGAGSCTLNATQTVGVAETITMAVALFVTKWYDQTGNGHDLSQATAGNQPPYVPACLNGLPCLTSTAATITLLGANLTPATGVVSLTGVGQVAVGSSTAIFKENGGGSNRILVATSTTTQVGGGSSGIINGAATAANLWHAIAGVINGASPNSLLGTDGTIVTGSTVGSTTAGAPGVVGAASITANFLEFGIWDNIAFTSGNVTSMSSNQHSYWSF